MGASFNDTLFNFRLIGLNWSVTVVFFSIVLWVTLCVLNIWRGGGHKLILSYYLGREISRVELVQLKKSWEIINCLIILMRGLFHSFSLSHFPSLSLFSFIPLMPLIPAQFIAIYSAHSTHLTAPHSVYYHSFRLFSSFTSFHFHSLSSFSFIPLIPLILIHSVHSTHSAHLISLYLVYSHSFRFIFTHQLVFIHSPLSHSLRFIISTHTFSYSFILHILTLSANSCSFGLISTHSAYSYLFCQFWFIPSILIHFGSFHS